MVVTLAASSGASTAATAQQEKMKTCNADATAKSLKGDERKTFMSSCLSNKPAAAAEPAKPLTAQQDKMKKCNTDAAGKTGEDRKAFMASCLKG
ncbi:PsiF family protein [Azospirillum sp. A29]